MGKDIIENPSHYNLPGLQIQSIDVVKSVLGKKGFEAFCKGNILKYVIREENKNGLEDLKKAKVYLDWLIKSKEMESGNELQR